MAKIRPQDDSSVVDPELRKRWLEAIERPNYNPKSCHGLCTKHFQPTDIYTESVIGGYEMSRVKLKTNCIPTIFSEIERKKEEAPSSTVTEVQSISNPHSINNSDINDKVNESSGTNEFNMDCTDSPVHSHNINEFECSIASAQQQGFDVYEELYVSPEPVHKNNLISEQVTKNNFHKENKVVAVQTIGCAKYNIEDYKDKPRQLQHFTGLTYEKYMVVLQTLKPLRNHFEKLEKSKNITVNNQLFLVLWKLRRDACNLELAEHFNISETCVSEIFHVWIISMAKLWSLIDIWPSRELVNFYMPHVFKNNYPKTRVTLDATELKIDAPNNPKLKQATFSTYKNSNTLKVMVGTSPGGLISYISEPYGGSTSDRQIIERSDLRQKCKAGDVILADKGIMVQDLFAPCDVTVCTPTPMVSGNLSHNVIVKDRKLSKHRVHVERIIGLMKTYTILSKKLTRDLLPLSSEIIRVCIMLANFKDNIM
ncbi:uncharacterized protein LOC111694225 [Trichogramma pretiosum]|uniref:uncharacterized protein LOC111694225 n=1 Tax=Trichogramma pretiosum TaxID=7493 RepID=UPI000C7188E7|nr:uncharacterized protein LOC111694225 [Trichogramma pretiosum]